MKHKIAMSVVVFSLFLPTLVIAQQRGDQSSRQQVGSSKSRAASPNTQVTRNTPAKQPERLMRTCKLDSFAVSALSLVLYCSQANNLGITTYFVSTTSNANKLDAELVVTLAQTKLLKPNMDLNIWFKSTEIPSGKLCLTRAFTDKNCREITQISLTPKN